LYFSPTNTLTITSGRSSIVGIATTVGAIANIGLNIAFIPLFGIYGAAATTAATYFIMFCGVYLIATRTVSIPMEQGRIVRLLISAGVVFGIGWGLSHGDILQSAVVKGVAVTLFPLILWGAGFFNENELRYLRSLPDRILEWKEKS